ncbi:Mitochondrial distribution and morphology protein 31, mitochondrial precursor [Gonapodya sp. JEL0774]|nr:Mitochondrial distribution and morphology protein 31, mitochondrial precursor [Gonapodya sp. JEL0774]
MAARNRSFSIPCQIPTAETLSARDTGQRRAMRSSSLQSESDPAHDTKSEQDEPTAATKAPAKPVTTASALFTSASQVSSRIYSASLRSAEMLQHPPKMADLVKAAQGFWPRLKLRVRMVLLGHTWRAWRADDILAVISLMVFSQFFFILVATTTFISLILMVINSLPFQDMISRLVAQYISDITWTDISFESGIVPQWREGVIRLNNVTVRRTFESEKRHYDLWRKKYPEKVTARKVGAQVEPGDEFDEETGLIRSEKNFMVFEVLIGELDLTLSLWRALEGETDVGVYYVHFFMITRKLGSAGKGLVKDCAIKNVQGVIDRRHVDFTGINWSADVSRAANVPGFFEMDRFTVQDVLVTVYQPNFRPFTLSVFNLETPQLRWEWFLFDLLNADAMVGMFDNCLFSLRKRKFGTGSADLPRAISAGSRGVAENWTLEDDELLARCPPGTVLTHARIDHVPIDHLNNNTIGPFAWITSGNVDIDCKILLPSSNPLNSILGVVAHEAKDIIDRIQDKADGSDVVSTPQNAAQSIITDPVVRDIKATIDGELPVLIHHNEESTPGRTLQTRIEESVEDVFMQNPLWRKMHQQNRVKAAARVHSDMTVAQASAATSHITDSTGRPVPHSSADPPIFADEQTVQFFYRIRMNNLKAAVPLATPEIGYLQGTMVRPLVAYMNAHRTLVPIEMSLTVPMSHFHGAWTVFDAYLYDKFADGMGKGVVALMEDDRERVKRIRRVGIWSLRSVAKNVRDLYDSFRGAKPWAALKPEEFHPAPFPV